MHSGRLMFTYLEVCVCVLAKACTSASNDAAALAVYVSQVWQALAQHRATIALAAARAAAAVAAAALAAAALATTATAALAAAAAALAALAAAAAARRGRWRRVCEEERHIDGSALATPVQPILRLIKVRVRARVSTVDPPPD